MNILFLSTHLNTGGITQYLLTLTKGFIPRDVHVHVACSGGNMEKDFHALGAKVLVLDIRTKSELSPKIYKAIAPLKKYIEKNHIKGIHSHTRITQVMGAMLGKVTGVPYVSTCHGFFKPRLSRRMIPCWGKRVIAISEAVEKHLKQDFGVDRQKIRLVKSGINLEDFIPMDSVRKKGLRAKYNLEEGPVIGMIARLSDVKGQDILVEAMKTVVKKFPTVKLLLIGEGKLEGVLRKMVAEAKLEEQVLFYPIVNKTMEMLSLLDIFINPSRQEGLGLSVMEAQASGVPVVATNVGGVLSLIEDGKTGVMVEPENPKALGRAIVKLLENKELLKKISLAAREQAVENYSLDAMVEKTIKVYEEVME